MKKKTAWIWGAIAALILLATDASASSTAEPALSYLGQSNLPLGMSRNNPGNIVRGVNYQGEILDDSSRFAKFENWYWGIRAMIVLLTKYITKGSSYPNACVTTPQNTIRLIITQWAPPTTCGGDNTPAAVANYIASVSASTGIAPDTILTANTNTLYLLVAAMSKVEQGRTCVTQQQFNIANQLV